MNWHLQDAKNNFSKVVQKALTEGPQTVTLRGKPTVVVSSIEDFQKRSAPNAPKKMNFIEFLLSGPAWDDDFVEEVNRRDNTPPRDIDF